MKICFISDTHTKHGFIKQEDLPEADVICHAGDISSRGYRHEIENFMAWFSWLPQFKHKIFIAGNHDFGFQDHIGEVSNILEKYPDVIYLQHSGVEIEGVKFWGSPATPWFHNWAFNYFRGDDIMKIWKLIPTNTDVLITHGPPYKHGDEVPNFNYNEDKFVGCKDLLKVVEEIKPKIHVFGHIHEGYGITKNDDTTFINASVLDGSYSLVNKPIYAEI